jgi:methionine-rich copper-binding protein CopC
VIGLLWAVAGALTASPASAHAGLVSATPSSGSTVDGIPAGVVLAFSSPVQARLAEVVVRDADGHDHVVGPVASFDTRVSAQVQGLLAGRYTVAYRVVSVDGHPVVGQYAFDVAARTGAAASGIDATTDPAPSASGGGRPWLAPLFGALAVVSAAVLRVRSGSRRPTS